MIELDVNHYFKNIPKEMQEFKRWGLFLVFTNSEGKIDKRPIGIYANGERKNDAYVVSAGKSFNKSLKELLKDGIPEFKGSKWYFNNTINEISEGVIVPGYFFGDIKDSLGNIAKNPYGIIDFDNIKSMNSMFLNDYYNPIRSLEKYREVSISGNGEHFLFKKSDKLRELFDDTRNVINIKYPGCDISDNIEVFFGGNTQVAITADTKSDSNDAIDADDVYKVFNKVAFKNALKGTLNEIRDSHKINLNSYASEKKDYSNYEYVPNMMDILSPVNPVLIKTKSKGKEWEFLRGASPFHDSSSGIDFDVGKYWWHDWKYDIKGGWKSLIAMKENIIDINSYSNVEIPKGKKLEDLMNNKQWTELFDLIESKVEYKSIAETREYQKSRDLLKNTGGDNTVCNYLVKGLNGKMKFSFPLMGDEIIDEYKICHTESSGGVQGMIYYYSKDAYLPLDDIKIAQICTLKYAYCNSAQQREVITYIHNVVYEQHDPIEFADEKYILCNDCIIDVETGDTLELTDKLLIPNKIPCNYKNVHKSKLLDQCINEWFKKNTDSVKVPKESKKPKKAKIPEDIVPEDDIDKDLVNLFFEMSGYCLYRSACFQKAFILIGSFGTGKSTVISLISSMVGSDNRCNLTMQDLMDKFKIIGIAGKLFNDAQEFPVKYIKDANKFKDMISGEKLTGEHKYQNPMVFDAIATHIFSSNTYPNIRDPENAILSRLIFVPMRNQFGRGGIGDKDNVFLRKQLKNPDVINDFFVRSIDGLKRLIKNGRFSICQSSLNESIQYRFTRDPLMRYLAEIETLDTIKLGTSIIDDDDNKDVKGSEIDSNLFQSNFIEWMGLNNVSDAIIDHYMGDKGKKNISAELKSLLPGVYSEYKMINKIRCTIFDFSQCKDISIYKKMYNKLYPIKKESKNDSSKKSN